jgi:hypothetical protein
MVEDNDMPFEINNIISKNNIKYKVVSIQIIKENGFKIYAIEQINSKHVTYLNLSQIKTYKSLKETRDENIDKIL